MGTKLNPKIKQNFATADHDRMQVKHEAWAWNYEVDWPAISVIIPILFCEG